MRIWVWVCAYVWVKQVHGYLGLGCKAMLPREIRWRTRGSGRSPIVLRATNGNDARDSLADLRARLNETYTQLKSDLRNTSEGQEYLAYVRQQLNIAPYIDDSLLAQQAEEVLREFQNAEATLEDLRASHNDTNDIGTASAQKTEQMAIIDQARFNPSSLNYWALVSLCGGIDYIGNKLLRDAFESALFVGLQTGADISSGLNDAEFTEALSASPLLPILRDTSYLKRIWEKGNYVVTYNSSQVQLLASESNLNLARASVQIPEGITPKTPGLPPVLPGQMAKIFNLDYAVNVNAIGDVAHAMDVLQLRSMYTHAQPLEREVFDKLIRICANLGWKITRASNTVAGATIRGDLGSEMAEVQNQLHRDSIDKVQCSLVEDWDADNEGPVMVVVLASTQLKPGADTGIVPLAMYTYIAYMGLQSLRPSPVASFEELSRYLLDLNLASAGLFSILPYFAIVFILPEIVLAFGTFLTLLKRGLGDKAERIDTPNALPSAASGIGPTPFVWIQPPDSRTELFDLAFVACAVALAVDVSALGYGLNGMAQGSTDLVHPVIEVSRLTSSAMMRFMTGVFAPDILSIAPGTEMPTNYLVIGGLWGLAYTIPMLLPAGKMPGGQMLQALFGREAVRSLTPLIFTLAIVLSALGVVGDESRAYTLYLAFAAFTYCESDVVCQNEIARPSLSRYVLFGGLYVLGALCILPWPFPGALPF